MRCPGVQRSVAFCGAVLFLAACSKPSPTVTSESARAVPSAAPAGSDYETVWCRGGGNASAATDVELLTFSAHSHGVYIETNFEFEASTVAAGSDGRALKSGTCAYADRPYGTGIIKLKFGEEEKGHLRWRTTAKGTSPVTAVVPADGVASDKWLMKARVTKSGDIGSYQTLSF